MLNKDKWTRQISHLKQTVSTFLIQTDETIGTKLFLAVFDKLVLGAFLFILVTVVQSNISKGQFRAEMAAKFVEIHDRNISGHRDNLSREIGLFLAALNELKVVNETNEINVGVMNKSLKATKATLEELKTVLIGSNFGPSISVLTKAMALSVTDASSGGTEGIQRSNLLSRHQIDIRNAAAKLQSEIYNAILFIAKDTAKEIY